MTDRLNIQGILAVIVAAVAFSSKSIWIKLLYQENLSTIQILKWRMLISFPAYLFWIFYVRKSWLNLQSREWLLITACGLLGYYLASYLDLAGLQYISAGLERLVLFTYPGFVLIFSFFLFKRKIQLRQYLALAIAYLGLAIIMQHQNRETSNLLLGIGLVLGSSLTYAGYLVGMESLLKKRPAIMIAAWSMIFSTVATMIHAAIAEPHQLLIIESYNSNAWILLFILAGFSTVLPNFLLAFGISKIGSDNTAIIGTLGPASTLVLAYFFLNEPMGFIEITGTGLFIYGIFVLKTPVKSHS